MEAINGISIIIFLLLGSGIAGGVEAGTITIAAAIAGAAGISVGMLILYRINRILNR